MKKNLFLIALFILTLVFLITGCTKEETPMSNSVDEQNIDMKSPNFFENPFDSNHVFLERMYQAIFDFFYGIEDHPEYEDFDVYMDAFSALIAKFYTPYHQYDFHEFNLEEQEIITKFMEIYFNDISMFDLEEASKNIEKKITLMPKNNLQQKNFQQSMFSIVSELKFTLFIIENLDKEIYFTSKKPSWDNRVVNCMGCKFDAFNPVEWIGFAVSFPVSAAWMLASCHYDATFRSHLHHDPC